MIWQQTQPNGPWGPPNKALKFGAATSDRVDFGSAAMLDNQNAMTIIAWVTPTAIMLGRRVWTKATGTTGKILVVNTGGTLYAFWAGSTNGQAITTAAPLVVGVPLGIAVVFDSAAAVTMNIYTRTLNTIWQLQALSTSVNVATPSDDAGASFLVGNQSAFSGAFTGDIHYVSVFNRALSLAEISNHENFKSGNILKSYLGMNGVGPQIDWTGNGNHGTITGATPTAGLPLFEHPNPVRILGAA